MLYILFQDGVLHGTFVSLSVWSEGFLFVTDFYKRSTLLYCYTPRKYSSKKIDSADLFLSFRKLHTLFCFRSLLQRTGRIDTPSQNQQLIHFSKFLCLSIIPKVFSPTVYLRQTDSGLFQRDSPLRWKVSFFGFGALALLWLPPWLLQAPSGRLERTDGWINCFFWVGGIWLGDLFGSFKVKQQL